MKWLPASLWFLAIIALPSLAQNGAELRGLSSVPVQSLPALDLERLAAEDEVRDAQPGPMRFAVARAVDVHPARAGEWQALAGGEWMWRMRFATPDAAHLNFGFADFHLPPNAKLSFVSADGRYKVGPFGAERNNPERVFFGPVVPGQEVVVILTVPAAEREAVSFRITQVGHGYRGFGFRSKACKSGSCNTDVACLSNGDPWNLPRRSVGAITVGGTDTCTGSLLNNTLGNRDLLFATATHCGITAGNAAAVTVYWNYEFATCRRPGSPESGAPPGPKPTDPWNIQTGATFLAATPSPFGGGTPGPRSDFTLLRLNGTPDPRANLYWAGWDRRSTPAVCARPSDPTITTGLCATIHHPGVDEKRITFVEQNFQVGNISGGVGVHWRADWAITPALPNIGATPTVNSVTEPGSSGSPLYTAEQRLVGVLSGGPSACGNGSYWDFYGALFHAWDGGGTPSTRMRDHLNPAGLDPAPDFIDGRGQCTPPAIPSGLSATPNGDNRIDLSWNPVAGAERYRIYRARGSCPGSGYTQIGESTTPSYSDTTVSGGITYAYRVTAFDDEESCESNQGSCANATATGQCRLPPIFSGLAQAQSAQSATCGIQLSWPAASAECPSATNVVYNVYRSTDANFVPSAANRIASCVSTLSYLDQQVFPGLRYHYVVRAEDDVAGGSGQCRNGNEDGNTQRRNAAAFGPDQVVFQDNASSNGNWTVDGSGAGSNFALVTDFANSPPSSWFVPNATQVSDRRLTLNVPIDVPPNAPAVLEFFHRYSTEANWDGGVLEYSLDGGTTWTDILAAQGSVPANPGRFLAGGYTGPLNGGSSANPLAGRPAWHGANASPLAFTRVAVSLQDFGGRTVRLRWRFGTDGSVGATGWWIDDFRVFAPTSCRYFDTVFADGFEPR